MDLKLKKNIIQYWSDGAEGYHKAVWNSLQPGGLKDRWQSLLQEGIGQEKTKILDVGTGPGVIALLLAAMGHKVTGIDMSSDMLEKAKENSKKLNLPVEFKEGDAESIPFPDSSFNVVISRHVLWTLPNPERALTEWKRVLKPGGKMVIIDGNWYISLDGSLKNQIWRCLAIPLTSILERRNAFHRRAEPEWRTSLPMTFKRRPEYDIKLLNAIGLRNAKAKWIDRRDMGLAEYLKYGYYGDTFLVSAKKENST